MSLDPFDSLLCAACGGRVADARCATCRAALSSLREGQSLPAAALLMVALAVLVAVLLLELA